MNKKRLRKMMRRINKEERRVPYTADETGEGFGTHAAWQAAAAGQSTHAYKEWLAGLGLPRGFASRQTEQFLLGALLGAAGAYVLADEKLRNKIVKSLMKLYAGLSGGIEELKEQMADLKAEVEAEQSV